MAKQLEDARIDDVYLDQVLTAHGLLHRVRVGPFEDPEALERLIARVRRDGLPQHRGAGRLSGAVPRIQKTCP